MHRIIKVILHLFFWLCYTLLAAGLSFKLEQGPEFLIRHLDVFAINYIWAMLAFYSTFLFGYKLFEKHHYVRYFGFAILLTFVTTGLFYWLYVLYLGQSQLIDSQQFYLSLPGTFIIANCGSLLRGFIHWLDVGQLKAEIEKRSLQHELDSLKAQINPHFLFNTLNNIDALIQINQQQASAALLKLSDILRYLLYSGNKAFIGIDEEVQHIQKIIELQLLRLVDTKLVQFSTNVSKEKVQIAPMLFTPFVENAFKYFVKGTDQPGIVISLNYSQSVLTFCCRNAYGDTKGPDSSTGGLGLQNVKRRLALLYPNQHTLLIKRENNIFEVELSLTIK